ncbi:MAG: hypothetical protein FWG89_10820 [Treponema sp.]|nr:hypothetical protein [Treponema sp.]
MMSNKRILAGLLALVFCFAVYAQEDESAYYDEAVFEQVSQTDLQADEAVFAEQVQVFEQVSQTAFQEPETVPVLPSANPLAALFNGNGNRNGPRLTLSGSVTGMASIGLMDDLQKVPWSDKEVTSTMGADSPLYPAPGVFYDPVPEVSYVPSRHGYYAMMDFSMLFNPIPAFDIFISLVGYYQPGSPYIPMQLREQDNYTFDKLFLDVAYGRINVFQGLDIALPVDVWIKTGLFEVAPAQVNRFANHGSYRSAALGSLRTTYDYHIQLEAAMPLSFAQSISASLTTNLRLKDSVQVLLDGDQNTGDPTSMWIIHGDYDTKKDIPFHAILRLNEMDLFNMGTFSAEFIYAYNAMNVFSGSNFGFGAGFTYTGVNNLTVPLGLGVALYGKNIDAISGMGKDAVGDSRNVDYINFYRMSGFHLSEQWGPFRSWDASTASFRQAIRFGIDLGPSYNFTDMLGLDMVADLNLSYIYSQQAHVLRDTITLNSITTDLRVTLLDHYFIGGGVFLGTLGDAVWKTKKGVHSDLDGHGSDAANTGKEGFERTFTLSENMGFEIYAGLKFYNARFVIGYNVNKGLALNNFIESIPEGQIKYVQEGTLPSEGLFERSGVFAKLTISW